MKHDEGRRLHAPAPGRVRRTADEIAEDHAYERARVRAEIDRRGAEIDAKLRADELASLRGIASGLPDEALRDMHRLAREQQGQLRRQMRECRKLSLATAAEMRRRAGNVAEAEQAEAALEKMIEEG